MVAGFSQLHGIMRTVLNQYDSLVRPLQKWLEDRSVHFQLNTRVSDLVFRDEDRKKTVDRIVFTRTGTSAEVTVGNSDYVFVTLGFTVEYSVRSPQTAVYSLLDLKRDPPAAYKDQYDPRNLYKAFKGSPRLTVLRRCERNAEAGRRTPSRISSSVLAKRVLNRTALHSPAA